LIETARRLAREQGGVATMAYTFDPAPRDVLRPDNDVPRIQSLDDRVQHLLKAGVDQVLVEPFDREFAGQTARWFAEEVLRRRLRVRGVVIGWDFRFGRGRSGGIDQLHDVLKVPVEQVSAVSDAGGVLSSSRVRIAVREGRVADASLVLGRPHDVVGRVVRGDQRGRALGFATANVVPNTPLMPSSGVYAVEVDVGDGRRHPGVANVGVRPTVGPGTAPLEVHLLDWSGDLYGEIVRVGLVARLRDERRFGSLDGLVDQIRRDVAAARKIL
jgi:riboflavin kinase/FMN adenylyltransferase